LEKIQEFKFKGSPLTEEQTKHCLGLLISKGSDCPLGEDTEGLKDELLAQIFLKRIEVYELPFKVSTYFFLMSLMTTFTNPGKVMILLRLCYQEHLKTGCSYFDIETWCDMFSFGPPTEEELSKYVGVTEKHGCLSR